MHTLAEEYAQGHYLGARMRQIGRKTQRNAADSLVHKIALHAAFAPESFSGAFHLGYADGISGLMLRLSLN